MKKECTLRQSIFLIPLFTVLLGLSLISSAQDITTMPISSISGKDGDIQFNDYSGKVILIDFWASWCGPCRQSFPWMNNMQAKYEDQGFMVIAINLDSEAGEARRFLKEVPADFLIGFDPEGLSAEKMNVEAMPMSYLIDRKGNIRHRMMGFNTEKKASHEAYIQALLSEAK